VCDVPARECRSWGTGASQGDHANAEPTGFWSSERARRRVPASSGVPRQFADVHSRYNSGRASFMAGAAAPSADRYPAFRASMQQAMLGPLPPQPPQPPQPLPPGHVATPPSAPTPLPDPRTLGPALLDLGVVELPVRAAARTSIGAVAAQLCRYGRAYPRTGAPCAAPPLTLETLFLDERAMRRAVAVGGPPQVTRHDLVCAGSDDEAADDEEVAAAAASVSGWPVQTRRAPLNLALRRMRMPHAAPRATVVHWHVLMVRADGAAPPEAHAVSLPRRARRADLLAAVEAAAALRADERIVLQVAWPPRADGPEPHSWTRGEYFNGVHVLEYQHGFRYGFVYGSHPAALQRRLDANRGNRPLRFVAHRLPGREPAPLSRAGKPLAARAGMHATAPSFVVLHLRSRKEVALDWGGSAVQHETLGFPILLPMPAAGAGGGDAAARELHAAVRAALRPLLRAGAAWRAPDALTRCEATGGFFAASGGGRRSGGRGGALRLRRLFGEEEDEDSYGSGGGGYFTQSSDDEDDEEEEVPFGTLCALDQMRDADGDAPVTNAGAHPLVHVAATWAADDAASLLDLAALASPAQHASAAAHPFDEAALLEEQRQEEWARTSGPAIVAELAAASSASWTPRRAAPGQGMWWYMTEPAVRYAAELVAAPGEAADALGGAGLLRLRVFAPRSYTGAAPLLQDCRLAAAPDGGAAARLRHTLDTLWAANSATHRANAALHGQLELAHCASPSRRFVGMRRPTPATLLAAIEARDLPEAPQPPGMAVQLRPHQLQSLRFMVDVEEGGLREAFWAVRTLPDGTRAWYSRLLDRLTRDEPSFVRGGFLCEEMGLGKTIVTLALVLANPQRAPRTSALIGSRATLVVCAVSLVGQWAAEVKERYTGGALSVHIFHGPNRLKDARKLADHDLVITTYATLVADYGGKKGAANLGSLKNPLAAIDWYRIVLDESHSIRNAATVQSTACLALCGQRRWCVTGTPIATDVGDLAAQMRFLRLEPWNNPTYFAHKARDVFGPAAHLHGTGDPLPLLYTLSRCMIRHTKQGSLGGAPVLSLPAVTESEVPVAFAAEERAAYELARQAAVAQFNEFKSFGAGAVNAKLLAIMSLLLPLRRIASGGALSAAELCVPCLSDKARAARAGKAAVDAKPVLPSAASEEVSCGICGEPADDAVKTGCAHVFCRECLLSSLPAKAASARCPTCAKAVDATALQQAADADDDDGGAAGGAAGGAGLSSKSRKCKAPPPVALRSESKLKQLLQELEAMREADPTAKALIFSQYTGTLEWLKTRLSEEGFGYRTISGSMPLKQRAAAITAFQTAPPTTVFLLSVRSGAVGLNLTAANYVFMMEPVLNQALQAQAIGRAWRMGQSRPVTVKHLFIKDSVEERIMTLNRDRAAGTGAAAGGGASAAALEAAKTKAKVSDIAGAIRSDRAALRLNELELLFS